MWLEKLALAATGIVPFADTRLGLEGVSAMLTHKMMMGVSACL